MAEELKRTGGVKPILAQQEKQAKVPQRRKLKPKSKGNKKGMRILPKKFGPKVRHNRPAGGGGKKKAKK